MSKSNLILSQRRHLCLRLSMLTPQNIFVFPHVDFLHLENENFSNVEKCLGITKPYKVQNLSVWSWKLVERCQSVIANNCNTAFTLQEKSSQ